MELLLFILIFSVPIYCLWIWGQRKDELTQEIDRVAAAYTATASIIAPNINREGDSESCRRVIIFVLTEAYDADIADRICEVILERASSREGRIGFSKIIFEGVLAQIEYEQNRPITPRQRKKISSILFRKRNIDELIWQ